MARRRTHALVALTGTGLAAWAVGHFLDYLLLAPDPHHRRQLLEVTGHGYLSALWNVAVAGGIIALFAVAGLGWARGAREGRTLRWPAVAARLCAVQVVAFVVVEIAERLLSGAPVGPGATMLVTGVALQVLTAALGTLLLRLVFGVAEAAARRRRRTSVATTPHRRFFRDTRPRTGACLPPGARAPPAFLLG